MTPEEIKPCPGFPAYMVSNQGYVTRNGVEITLFTVRGYLAFNVVNGAKNRKSLRIHRVIGILFIPNPHNYPAVRHLDGDKQNPHVDNLAWGTGLMNEEDKRQHGRIMEGEKHHQHKLTDEQVLKIRSYAGSMYDLLDEMNVGIRQLYHIKAGKAWQHI